MYYYINFHNKTYFFFTCINVYQCLTLLYFIQQCPSCVDSYNNTSSIQVPTKNGVFDTVERISVGFNMRLRRNIAISGRTFMELGAFHQVI